MSPSRALLVKFDELTPGVAVAVQRSPEYVNDSIWVNRCKRLNVNRWKIFFIKRSDLVPGDAEDVILSDLGKMETNLRKFTVL